METATKLRIVQHCMNSVAPDASDGLSELEICDCKVSQSPFCKKHSLKWKQPPNLESFSTA